MAMRSSKSRNGNHSLALELEQLEPRYLLATLQVIAAGVEQDEVMTLRIDGSTVRTWTVGGDAYAGQFLTFTHTVSGNVSANQVRIQFENDLYDPANNIDRNLRVDALVIDGTRYETESPTVYSTGTWKPADGITPGFRESEYLHANGYFQYAEIGSTIRVRAAGTDGRENMRLEVDGTTVATWNAIGTTMKTYQYIASSQVTADQVRVYFTNDSFDQANNIDYNLQVDWMSIDTATYQTEHPSVYSTGTWKPSDGIVPGFRESEFLHTDGYFEYAVIPANHGVVSLQQNSWTANETSGQATVVVRRTNGSDGTITIDYRTVNGTAIAGQDYQSRSGTLTFAPGQTQKSLAIKLLNDTILEGKESFSFTIDNVQGGASLLAPRTAVITIVDDEQQLPNITSFSGIVGLSLNGSAQLASPVLRLTSAVNNQAGSSYFTSALGINDDTSFQTSFKFRATGGNGSAGADGFVFALQNSAAGVLALGGSGGSLGYGGISNSLAIEFDTFRDAWDASNNHISVLINGNPQVSLATRAAPLDLNSGSHRYAWVDYNGFTNQLSVFLSATSTKPTTAVVTTSVDIREIVGSRGFVGFSAGTGGQSNNHEILMWTMNDNVPASSNPPSTGSNLAKEIVANGFSDPTAIDWLDQGRNMLIAQQNGIVRVIRNGVLQATPFIDISQQVNGTRDRGLLGMAVHPDFANKPYVYLLFTYDPPQVFNYTGLAGPDGNGNRAGRLIRVTANAATNYTTAVAGSEVVLLGKNSVWSNFNGFVNSTTNFSEKPAGILPDGTNIQDFIASDSESHTVGAIDFAPDGSLFVSIGDGTSYNQVDSRTVRVQDIDNLSGKILRIDPITGKGLTTNPFYNGDANANRSKVYQYGLRNPFRIAAHPTTGQLYVGDVGWAAWEEINSAGAGANFGWPYFEGGSGTSIRTNGYKDLAAAQAFYNSGQQVTSSIFALNHSADGINAIVMGDIYVGSAYPSQFVGDVFVNDLGQGIVRNLSLNASGQVVNVETFTTGANVVVQIIQGPDGNMYFVDLDDGTIGRWIFI
jgi:glucose/arabinose dehydrogenase